MTVPVNFLYLGGDKCGSTWVHSILSRHPDVSLATAKELFYFDRFYHKGPRWYARQFPSDQQARRVGEICHDYLYSETALHRIASDLPLDSRFLVTVRDPIERTVSHYAYLRKIGRTRSPFPDALEQQPQIIEHSLFGKYVARAQAILGEDRVFVLPFSLLKTDPTAFGKALCTALDIPFLPQLPYDDKVLEAQTARSPQAVRVLRSLGWGLRRLGAPQIVSHVKSSAYVQHWLYSKKKPTLDVPADILTKLETRFAPDQSLLRTCAPHLECAA